MAGQVIPFDPYEERRRRLLAQWPSMGRSQEPPQIAPSTALTAQDVPGPVQGPMPPTPAQEEYGRVLGQRPTREEYEPSRLRKVLSVLAGAAAGFGGGIPAGIRAAEWIQDRPYERATGDWRENLRAAMAPVEFGQEMRKEGREVRGLNIEQQRADISQQQVEAREPYYAGMGAAGQARARAWAPETEEEYGRAAQARLPVPVPRAPTAYQSQREHFEEDPSGFAQFERAQRAPSLSVEDRVRIAQAGPEATAAHRVEPGIDPTDYNTAEQLATQRVLSDPIYAEFMEWEEGIPGLKEPDPDWDPAKMQRYYDMLEARDEETERILSMSSSGQQVLPPGESNYEGGIVRD